MQWNDECFLLSKNNYGENSIIIEIFAHHYGRCSGIVYGGTSKKLKNYLQLGNKIHVSLKSKNESKIGYFKVEIIEPISPFFFHDKKKLNCLLSALNLLKIVLPEMQSYKSIYFLFSEFLKKLKSNDNWIFDYISWEINLFKEIGFDMNLKSNLTSINSENNSTSIVVIDNEKIYVPSFIIENKFKNVTNKSIYQALKLLGKYFEKKIIIPNNLNYPLSRKTLEDLYR